MFSKLNIICLQQVPPCEENMNFMPAGLEEDNDEEFDFGDGVTQYEDSVEQPRAPFQAQAPSGSWDSKTVRFQQPRKRQDMLKKSSRAASRGARSDRGSKVSKAAPLTDYEDVIPIEDFKSAVTKNNVDAIQSYIDKGFTVDTTFSSGWTGLMYAANCACPEAVKLLLGAGANPNFSKDMYTCLMAACASSRKDEEDRILECVCLLIDHKADKNAVDRYHTSPLIYVAREGKVSVVKKLLECGANSENQDTRGYTALMWAATRGHIGVVNALLQGGADPNRQSGDGRRAIDIAQTQDHTQVYNLLKHHTNKEETTKILTAAEVEATQKKKMDQEEAHSVAVAMTSSNSNQGFLRYGELELFLAGLDLGNLIPVFRDNQVDFKDFLRLRDADLQKLGITQLGVRKKLLDGIQETHKKNWEMSSLPPLQYNKRLSCEEVVAIVENIKSHLRYLGSSIGHISDEIKSDNTILNSNTQEGSRIQDLCTQCDETMTNVRCLYEEVVILRRVLSRVQGKEEFKPADLVIPSKSKQKFSRRRKVGVLLLGVTSIGIAIFVFQKETVVNSVSRFFQRAV